MVSSVKYDRYGVETILLNPTKKQSEIIARQKGIPFLKEKPSLISKALDIISAPLSQPRTTFTQGIGAGAAAVRERREDIKAGRKGGLGVIGTTLSTTATIGTGVLAGAGAGAAGAAGATARAAVVKLATSKAVLKTAGGVAAVAAFAPKTFRRFISTPGAVETGVAAAINPIAGIAVGLEKGTGLIGTAAKEFLANPTVAGAIETAKDVALPVAAIGAAGTGGVIATKKFLESRKEKVAGAASAVTGAIPKNISLPTSAPATSIGAGSVATTESKPLIAKKPEAVAPTTTPPTIKNMFKPKINIAIAQ
jgi:hypothetical protein